ncbi:hypothetical protein BZG36_00613 [Bifiguratus adelaidae]|uniref:WD40 repeat-containing protein SMU1 n=1 Tax=Bifiguratus adelaidae TaxID=1938954 RepID=A0A261Y760_9FUNG|nr:hypothetical protein BZG36_00613 [Bifiguratus adelaidae]
MSNRAKYRLQKEYLDVSKSPDNAIHLWYDESNFTRCKALIIGPPNTPYAYGFFEFALSFPNNYPDAPPKVTALTTSQGRTRFNPNASIYAGGKVCLSILGTWRGESGENWSSAHGISSILLSIQSLMSDSPYHNEPGHEGAPIHSPEVVQYSEKIQHETLRIAVCDRMEELLLEKTNGALSNGVTAKPPMTLPAVSAALSGSASEPTYAEQSRLGDEFEDLSKRLFLLYYDNYKRAAIAGLSKGTDEKPFFMARFEGSGNQMSGNFDYKSILNRLDRIFRQLEEETKSWIQQSKERNVCESLTASNLRAQYEEIKEGKGDSDLSGVGDVYLVDDNPFIWEVIIFGKPMTHYDGGLFKCRLVFNQAFPTVQPRVQFVTPMFHPHISKEGFPYYKPRRSEDVKSHVDAVAHLLHTDPRPDPIVQDETGVALNNVDSVQTFMEDIQQGRWDLVLRTVTNVAISPSKLSDLYEQIILELLEERELGAARTLLRQTEPMQIIKTSFPDRYMRLEQLLSHSYFDAKEIYSPGTSKEKRRKEIAKALESEVTTVPPSRLLTLLGQSLKWQQQQGIVQPETPFDLYRGAAPVIKEEVDAIPKTCYNTVKFPSASTHAESAIFSPNGQYMVTGSSDGFIEVWNYLTGKLRKDLKYQANENYMSMEEAVLCLNFSKDGELLVSGDHSGKIAVWKIQSGLCTRRISPAHSQGVTSVCFNKEGTQVLSGSFDSTVKLHGLKSGKALKEFRGHTSFVNSALFSTDMTKVISGSSDGTVRIWDLKSTNCLKTISSLGSDKNAAGLVNPSINAIISIPKTDRFLVCNKSASLSVLSATGTVDKTLTMPAKPGESGGQGPAKAGVDFVACATSAQGDIVYGVSENSTLYCFSMASGEVVEEMKLTDAEVIGIVHHPYSNVIAAYTDNGRVLLWKA